MKACPERSAALALLRKYNAEPFHIQHGLTVEGVMRWYAQELGYGEDADFWAAVEVLFLKDQCAAGTAAHISTRYIIIHKFCNLLYKAVLHRYVQHLPQNQQSHWIQ